MADTSAISAVADLLAQLETAHDEQQISAGAVDNIRTWLTDRCYSPYASMLAEHIRQGQWQVLDDVFWTVVPFGTGGRRGRMYPIGCNAINHRTIGESAQGLADYVKSAKPRGPWSAAIAYDTRHHSREFAELSAGILVANNFTVYFIDDFRSTPELSFLIRYKACDCGIMVTASHNPPSDNAVKVYWSTGGQLVPPHDRAVIDRVMEVKQFEVADFAQSIAAGKIQLCKDEIDRALLHAHLAHSVGGPRDLKVLYSPLHGVGEFNVRSLLAAAGFRDVEVFPLHRAPDGDFPNVPQKIANPENPRVFDSMIQHARRSGLELALATDPDCDRMGAAAPLGLDPRGTWATLNGNQLGALLVDFVVRHHSRLGPLTEKHFVVSTLVTTRLICRIAKSYGVQCYNNNLVGFKWIADVVDRQGPEWFLFGTEESHGYSVGTYARDKDGAVACMLMAELAAACKAEGISLHQKLDQLFQQHGYHAEQLLTIKMEGSDGMRQMHALMEGLRQQVLTSLGTLPIARLKDYQSGQVRWSHGKSKPLDGPRDNLVVMETAAEGNYVAVRPSGTEPKVKMYMFTFVPPDQCGDLDLVKQQMQQRLAAFELDLKRVAESV